MLIAIRNLLFATGKGLGAFGLGGAILWYVAVHCGPKNGIAYVHVSTPNVEVMVDDVEYHVETLWETPLVCELSPGPHRLRMIRNGKTVFEDGFSLGVGKELVLVAWDQTSETQAGPPLRNSSLSKIESQWRFGRKAR
jgi:hypothetical protein